MPAGLANIVDNWKFDMPRLFTGLQLPSEIASELSQFKGGIPGARWIEESDYHITLRFIGDIDLQRARDIDEELSQIHAAPLNILIEGLDSFGGARPRFVMARVRQTTDLLALQADHERTIRRTGGPADKRKFSPHVTLARLRNSSPGQVADFLSAKSVPSGWSFTASEFVLFSARESTGGGPYHVEAVYPLAARPALRPAANQ